MIMMSIMVRTVYTHSLMIINTVLLSSPSVSGNSSSSLVVIVVSAVELVVLAVLVEPENVSRSLVLLVVALAAVVLVVSVIFVTFRMPRVQFWRPRFTGMSDAQEAETLKHIQTD